MLFVSSCPMSACAVLSSLAFSIMLDLSLRACTMYVGLLDADVTIMCPGSETAFADMFAM